MGRASGGSLEEMWKPLKRTSGHLINGLYPDKWAPRVPQHFHSSDCGPPVFRRCLGVDVAEIKWRILGESYWRIDCGLSTKRVATDHEPGLA